MQVMIEDGIRRPFQGNTPQHKDNRKDKKDRHENHARLFNTVTDISVTDQPAQKPDKQCGCCNWGTNTTNISCRLGQLKKLAEKETLGVGAPGKVEGIKEIVDAPADYYRIVKHDAKHGDYGHPPAEPFEFAVYTDKT